LPGVKELLRRAVQPPLQRPRPAAVGYGLRLPPSIALSRLRLRWPDLGGPLDCIAPFHSTRVPSACV